MSLQYILAKMASVGGLNLNSPEQKLLEIANINSAAEELYAEFDLIGSLWAQYVKVTNTSGMMVSLPHYVGAIRAVRVAAPNMKLALLDQRPRFQAKTWRAKDFIAWQLKGESYTSRDLSNDGLITVTFVQPCEKVVKVTISGRTNYSEEDSETLTFGVGDTAKTTTKSFETVAINKDVTCRYNATVTDVDGTEIASIPNNQLRPLYLRAMIFNPPTIESSLNPNFEYYELLWKLRFKPFINLTDEFLCPGYDDAILWKVLELTWRFKQASSPDEVLAYSQKANEYKQKAAEAVAIRSKDVEQSIEKIMNISSDPIFDAFGQMECLQSYYPDIAPYSGGPY